jgi:hypothetical protein
VPLASVCQRAVRAIGAVEQAGRPIVSSVYVQRILARVCAYYVYVLLS